jgi:hypothetical protein
VTTGLSGFKALSSGKIAMNPDPHKPGADDLHAAPARPKSGPAPQTRPTSGPAPNIRMKSGPAPTLRPKSGPVAGTGRKTGAVPLPGSHEGLDLTMASVEGQAEPQVDTRTAAEIARDALNYHPPPPEQHEKVDFEHHPEFVRQRRMLLIVRLVALAVVTAIVTLILWLVLRTGKAAKENLEPIIDTKPVETNGNK